MEPNHLITLQLEGTDADDGHVRLGEFLEKLKTLQEVLAGIDKLVGGTKKPALYYRVVKLSHSSPVNVVLEAVVRDKTQRRRKQASEQIIAARHSRFFSESNLIREKKTASADVDHQLLRKMETLAQGRGKSFKTAAVLNGKESFPIDEQYESGVKRILTHEERSFGTYEGRLDTANLHEETNNFWIYPPIGPERVFCHCPPGQKEKIRDAMLKYVKVTGMKFFRPGSQHPYRIECKDFEIQERSESDITLLSLKGLAANQEGTGQLHDAITDEWE